MADRSVSVAIKAEVSGFVAGLNTARANVTAFNSELQKSAAKRQALSDLGNTAGKVGLVAAAGLGAAVMASANFDKAMSSVQAATHESAGAMEDLRQAALDAGADTVFSASEAASGIEALAKAGVETADILGGGLSGALDLAAAGELGVQEAAEAAAGAMAQFNLEGSQVPHIADLLAAGAGKAQGEVSDMVMALKQGGTVAAQMGLSLEETTGALAAFAEQSLLGSDAGTSFKQFLAGLTPNSTKAKELMDELGFSAFDASGEFVGMAETAGRLREALGGMTDEQRLATLETLFGSDAVRAASIVYDQGAEGIQGWIDKTNDAGYAAETAAIKLDNLAGDVEALKGSLETALIGAGDGAQGPLRKIVQGMTSVVNAFNDLPPAAQNATTGLLAVTAVTGGGLWFGAKVIGGIVETKNALDTLSISSPRAAGALGKLGRAAGAAGIALGGLAVVDAIQNNLETSVPGVQSLTQALLDLGNASTAAGIEAAKESLGDLLVITNERSWAPDQVYEFADSLERLADPNLAQGVQDNLSGMLGGLGGGSELEAAKAQIEGLDAALANIATSAGADVAADALADFADAAGLSESEVDTLMGLLPGYKEALAGAATSAELAASATSELTGASRAGARASDNYTEALAANTEAMQERRAAALEAVDANLRYNASLLDSNKFAREHGRVLKGLKNAADAHTRVQIEAVQTLNDQAAAWNELNEKAQNAPGAFREAKRALFENARAFGLSKDAARLYVKQVMEIPSRRVTAVVVETGAAMSALQRFQAFKLTDKYVDVHVRTDQHSAVGADGMTVPGQRSPYGDKVRTFLAPGEEVISNRHGQADRWRPLLKAINANALAGGGTVGRLLAPIGMRAMAGPSPELVQVVTRLETALSKLPAAVRDGAQVGSYAGTSGRLAAQGQGVFLQTGGL